MKLEIIAYTFDMGQCSAFQVTINFFISQSGRHNFLNSLRNMMSLQQVSCNWLSLQIGDSQGQCTLPKITRNIPVAEEVRFNTHCSERKHTSEGTVGSVSQRVSDPIIRFGLWLGDFCKIKASEELLYIGHCQKAEQLIGFLNLIYRKGRTKQEYCCNW